MAALTGVYAQDRTHAPLVAAIRLGPRSIAGYLTGSHIDERSGDYAHALDDADQAVRLEPRSATALNARCWNGAILSRLDAAPDDCDAAVQRDCRMVSKIAVAGCPAFGIKCAESKNR